MESLIYSAKEFTGGSIEDSENLKHGNDIIRFALWKDNFGWSVKDRLEWVEIIGGKLLSTLLQ